MTVETSPILGLPMVDARCTYPHRGGNCSGKDAYRMVGNCSNCKSRVVGLFTVGLPGLPVQNRLYWKGLEDNDPAAFADPYVAALPAKETQ